MKNAGFSPFGVGKPKKVTIGLGHHLFCAAVELWARHTFFLGDLSPCYFLHPLHSEAGIMTQVGEPVSGLALEACGLVSDFDFSSLIAGFPNAKKNMKNAAV